MRRLIVGAQLGLAVLLVPISLQAQNPAPTTGQVETGQRDASQRAEGLMDGNKPFRLSVDPTGDFTYDIDDETKELRKLTARKNVVFAGDELALNSDELEYDAVTGALTAAGRRVVVRQGEITVTCQLFTYNPSTQQSEMMGNPTIYNKGKDGKVNFMSGDRIVIFKTNGRTQVKVFGAPGRAPVLSNSQDGSILTPSGSSQPSPINLIP